MSKGPGRRRHRFLLLLLCLALLCALLRLFIFHLVRVEGTSMVDTLRSGEIALVTLFDYRSREPQRCDVVECRFPGREGAYLKRVIGLPGERVELRDGRTRIDGVPLSEPYVTGPLEDYSVQLGPDEYLMLGDNRSESYDSRAAELGPIHRNDFIGHVRLVLWPFRSVD